MNRTKENQELLDVIDKAANAFKIASVEERDKLTNALSMSVLMDISRSLAVIADMMQAEKETE